jgi:rhodanese-related sulfurtransferase
MFNLIIYIIDAVLVVILLIMFFIWAYNRIQAKRIGGELDNDQFKAGMRKAQIVDLREKASFKRKHIDGARNLPYSMFKYQYTELRPDLPVYLYSDSLSMSLKAARRLQKNGFAHIFWLKDGFEKWDGRTKASKY